MHNIFTRDRLLSLMAAPLIWTGHFVVCYVAVSLSCAFGMVFADMAIAIATVGALALIGYAALTNYHKWQRERHAADRDSSESLQAFFALNSLLLCGLSALALVWVAFPALMLPTCAA